MNKEQLYESIKKQLQALLENEHDTIANAANTAAILFSSLPDINWAGFYFFKNDELILGPFQGKPACMHIPLGKGVCGTAADKKEIMVVSNVHAFPGHIACDSESLSEIVIPIIYKEKLFGVLDIDSPYNNQFNEVDAKHLQDIVKIFLSHMT